MNNDNLRKVGFAYKSSGRGHELYINEYKQKWVMVNGELIRFNRKDYWKYTMGDCVCDAQREYRLGFDEFISM